VKHSYITHKRQWFSGGSFYLTRLKTLPSCNLKKGRQHKAVTIFSSQEHISSNSKNLFPLLRQKINLGVLGINVMKEEKFRNILTITSLSQLNRLLVVLVYCSVGITTGYGTDGRGSIPEKRYNFSPQCLYRLWDPPNLIYRVVFPGIKRPGLEADHSPPCSSGLKNARIYTSTPTYVFMAWLIS
jgi:hypothetical protein